MYCHPVFQQFSFQYNGALIRKTTQHVDPIQVATLELDIATLVTYPY